MGFRFVCQHCEKSEFYVYWAITQRGMINEADINIQCVACKTEFVLQPKIQWNLMDFTHAVLTAIDDKGKIIEIPTSKCTKEIKED